ncbi:hypothetical protein SDC9_140823 [bioreactor metagenome]|uniref:Uncharacterized protein n=1 Tax=bioreactor metagenome TaxID=1076179 RepID=A0A645DWI7_9ZZZZ
MVSLIGGADGASQLIQGAEHGVRFPDISGKNPGVLHRSPGGIDHAVFINGIANLGAGAADGRVVDDNRIPQTRQLVDGVGVVAAGADGGKAALLVFQTAGAALFRHVLERSVVSGNGAQPELSGFHILSIQVNSHGEILP